MKTIPYNGRDVPLPEMARVLGLDRATLANRWRKHEAGELTMEQVLCRERLKPPPPPKPPPTVPAEQLREMLLPACGHYPPVGKALGITRSGVHQMVARMGLLEFAKGLREKAAAKRREERQRDKPPPKAAPFHVDTEQLRELLQREDGFVTRVAKVLGVPYSSARRAVGRAGLARLARRLRVARRKARGRRRRVTAPAT